jgi:tetratricopeptide (TPR) repeat protein
MAKKKYTRKWMKEPDEFLTTSSVVINYINDHWFSFLIGLTGLLLFLGIGWGLFYYKSRVSYKISEEITRAAALYHDDNLKEGVKHYQQIIENYGNNEQTLWARLYLAHIHYQQKNLDQAIRWYKEVLAHASKDANLLRAIALLDLGYTYEELGKLEKAVENFTRLSQLEGSFFREESYMALGRCYEQKGDKENAIKYYKKYLEKQKEVSLEDKVVRLGAE